MGLRFCCYVVFDYFQIFVLTLIVLWFRTLHWLPFLGVLCLLCFVAGCLVCCLVYNCTLWCVGVLLGVVDLVCGLFVVCWFWFAWCFVVTVFGICLLGAWHCLHFLYVGFSNAGGWLSVLLCCECGCVCLRCFDAMVSDGCVDDSVLLLLVSIASLLLCLC